MGKDPAILFYTADFLVGTSLMTNEQVGMYIKLLCHQHQNGHLSRKNVESICGTFDEDVVSKFAQDEQGKYFNDRLEEESIKRSKYAESRRNNRLKINNEDTSIYLIRNPNDGLTKIGSSNKPERRLLELKAQMRNQDLFIVAYVDGVSQEVERKIHKEYVHKNSHNEWFDLSEEEVNNIILSNHMNIHMNNHMSNHMENENENINENINEDINTNNKHRKSKGNSSAKKVFIPPTLIEVKEYAASRGRLELANTFYEYYKNGEPPWTDRDGIPVNSWKQKFITWEHRNQAKKDNKKSLDELIESGVLDE